LVQLALLLDFPRCGVVVPICVLHFTPAVPAALRATATAVVVVTSRESGVKSQRQPVGH
jgi:hypothetical protein